MTDSHDLFTTADLRPGPPPSSAIAFALFVATCLIIGCQPSAPDPKQSSAESGPETLVLGTSGDYPPFSDWPREVANPRGFSIELAEHYARATGRSIRWRRFDWPELLVDLEAHRFEAALSGVTVRPDRTLAGRFSLAITTSGAVVLVDAESPVRSASGLDAPDIALAVNAGGHLERVARRLFPTARIVPVPTNAEVLDRLGCDGVNGIVTDTVEAPLWQARRPGLRRIGPLTRDGKAALFGLGRDRERTRFDRWLLEAEASGLLATLRARHGLPESATASPARALAMSLDERLSLMTQVADTKIVLGRPVEDRGREARVLAAAAGATQREAARRGVEPPDPKRVEAFYLAQIEAAKSIQRARRRSLARAPAPRDESARETARRTLEERIRPALIALGDRIALLVVACADAPPPPDGLLRETLADHALPEDDLLALEASFRTLFRAAAESARPLRPAPATPGRAPSA